VSGLGAWLAAIMGPLTGKVLMALGFSVVSVVGVTTALAQIRTLMLAHAGEIPAAAFQFALLGGVGEGLGLILGAIAFRVALWSVANTTRILGVAS
jgi:hypothetical protein